MLLSGSGSRSTLFTGSFPVGFLFVAMLVAGAGLLVPGVWLWWIRREPRAYMGDRMDAINERLEVLNRDERYRREDERRGRSQRRDEEQAEPPPAPPPPGEPYQL